MSESAIANRTFAYQDAPLDGILCSLFLSSQCAKEERERFSISVRGDPNRAQRTRRPYCHGVDSHSSHHPRLAQLPRPALHPQRCRLRIRVVTITSKLSKVSFNL